MCVQIRSLQDKQKASLVLISYEMSGPEFSDHADSAAVFTSGLFSSVFKVIMGGKTPPTVVKATPILLLNLDADRDI